MNWKRLLPLPIKFYCHEWRGFNRKGIEMKDPLYFPRQELASALLGSLKSGISHAFTLFAPAEWVKHNF